MTTEELGIIINALDLYENSHLTEKERFKVKELSEKMTKKYMKKLDVGYLIIRGSWSGYSGQNNCYKGERRSKSYRMSRRKAEKYIGEYMQPFSDGTYNSWNVTFETKKPIITGSLGGYEKWLKEKGLPV